MALFFPYVLCCKGSQCSHNRYCSFRRNSSHTYECRLTKSEICVDTTSKGLLLTERQVRAPLCGTELLKAWPFGLFTLFSQKRSLCSQAKTALRNGVEDADGSRTNSVLVEGWWKVIKLEVYGRKNIAMATILFFWRKICIIKYGSLDPKGKWKLVHIYLSGMLISVTAGAKFTLFQPMLKSFSSTLPEIGCTRDQRDLVRHGGSGKGWASRSKE